MLTKTERTKIEKLAWYAQLQVDRNKQLLATCQSLQAHNERLVRMLKTAHQELNGPQDWNV